MSYVMHIPDGSLSPSTCAAMYCGALPFWYAALRRCKRQFSARLIPLVSVFAAFSFVIMMFNIPLPGGTSGHAVGVAIAAIVLGPGAAIVSISVALFIQALLFGDGGITTFGANCFNMAIAGSLVSFFCYRMLAGGGPPGSRRRLVASGIAGYLAINASALLASVEFGIQPMLFRDAGGAPLYAPYPLSIAVPAMMIGHLTFAGLAEAIVTAGVVGYLARAFPALLGDQASAVASDTPVAVDLGSGVHGTLGAARATRRLWLVTAMLLLLTPLGLLAAGSAWGEWSPEDFSDPAARAQIAAASRDQAPPALPPGGLARLSKIWTAPMSHYSPSFMKSAAFGYVLSAMTGCGLILLASVSISALVRSRRRRAGRTFLEKTADHLLRTVEYSLEAESLAHGDGLLQRIDPRIKVIGMFAVIVAAALARNVPTILCLFIIALVAAVLSRIPVRTLAVRIWIAVLFFTGAIALPAVFVTSGREIARIPLVGWSATAQGMTAALYLLARVETAATIAALLVLSTPWPHLLKALRVLGVPTLVVVVLSMSYRYSFLILRTAHEMFESRRSRMVGILKGPERRRFAASTVGVLLSKTIDLGGEVYLAMISRGFKGDAYTLDDFETGPRDWAALTVLAVIAGLAVWFGLGA